MDLETGTSAKSLACNGSSVIQQLSTLNWSGRLICWVNVHHQSNRFPHHHLVQQEHLLLSFLTQVLGLRVCRSFIFWQANYVEGNKYIQRACLRSECLFTPSDSVVSVEPNGILMNCCHLWVAFVYLSSKCQRYTTIKTDKKASSAERGWGLI